MHKTTDSVLNAAVPSKTSSAMWDDWFHYFCDDNDMTPHEMETTSNAVRITDPRSTEIQCHALSLATQDFSTCFNSPVRKSSIQLSGSNKVTLRTDNDSNYRKRTIDSIEGTAKENATIPTSIEIIRTNVERNLFPSPDTNVSDSKRQRLGEPNTRSSHQGLEEAGEESRTEFVVNLDSVRSSSKKSSGSGQGRLKSKNSKRVRAGRSSGKSPRSFIDMFRVCNQPPSHCSSSEAQSLQEEKEESILPAERQVSAEVNHSEQKDDDSNTGVADNASPAVPNPIAIVSPPGAVTEDSTDPEGWDRWVENREYPPLDQDGSDILMLPKSVRVLELSSNHKANLVGGVDSLCLCSSSLASLASVLSHDVESVLRIPSLTTRFDIEKNSRLRYKKSEFVAPSSHGKAVNEVPLHFCPNFKLGTCTMPSLLLTLHIRMYLIQDEYICSRFISEYELAVLNAAMNGAITFPGCFSLFNDVPEEDRYKYTRHRNCLSKFESKSGKFQKGLHMSSCTNVFSGGDIQVFLLLLTEALVEIADAPEEWRFDWSGEQHHGLPGQQLNPNLMQRAARNILRKSFFVAEAVGVKDSWPERLRKYNISYDDRTAMDAFAFANHQRCVKQLRNAIPRREESHPLLFILYDVGINIYPNTFGHSLSLDGLAASRLVVDSMGCSRNESMNYQTCLSESREEESSEDGKFYLSFAVLPTRSSLSSQSLFDALNSPRRSVSCQFISSLHRRQL